MTPESLLQTAAAELDQVTVLRDQHIKGESAAAASSGAYRDWYAERDRLEFEHGRLTQYIQTLQAQAEAEAAEARRVALYKRRDAQVRANAALAKRLKTDGPKASAILLELLALVAEAEKEDQALNRLLPDDDRILSADLIARGGRLQREEISRREVQLWVTEDGGGLVGDQSRVEPLDDGRGRVPLAATNGRPYAYYVKRKFFEIEYRPAEDRRYEPLVTAIKLPLFTRRGFAWDLHQTNGLDAALDRMNVSDERPVLTELVPAEPLPKKPIPGHLA